MKRFFFSVFFFFVYDFQLWCSYCSSFLSLFCSVVFLYWARVTAKGLLLYCKLVWWNDDVCFVCLYWLLQILDNLLSNLLLFFYLFVYSFVRLFVCLFVDLFVFHSSYTSTQWVYILWIFVLLIMPHTNIKYLLSYVCTCGEYLGAIEMVLFLFDYGFHMPLQVCMSEYA